MPTSLKYRVMTMKEFIEDQFGEVDIEMLTVTSNIPYHVGYRKANQDSIETKGPYEPYGEWVWHARYWAWEDE